MIWEIHILDLRPKFLHPALKYMYNNTWKVIGSPAEHDRGKILSELFKMSLQQCWNHETAGHFKTIDPPDSLTYKSLLFQAWDTVLFEEDEHMM